MDTVTAAAEWTAFLARVAELGGRVVEGEVWPGRRGRARLVCRSGHECAPRVDSVMVGGTGLCRWCRSGERRRDVVYVVSGVDRRGRSVVKVGIGSAGGRPRLRVHAAAGLATVHRWLVGLPEGVAAGVETAALIAAAGAGYRPVQGWEYLPIGALATVLDVIDGHGLDRYALR